MCLVVTIDGARYVVDVGYGGDAAMQPIPLVSGTEFTVLAPRRGRLEYRSIDLHTDKSQRLWVYSTCDAMDDGDGSVPWVEQYCFVELEFFPRDYVQMNYFTSQSPTSFFTPHLLGARALVEDDGSGTGTVRLVGILTYLKTQIRRRMEGSMDKEVLATLTTEQERIDALQKWFLIRLSEEDRQGIFTTRNALGQ